MYLKHGIQCARVLQRIECPECWYPFSEAAQGLHEIEYDPGHQGPTYLQRLQRMEQQNEEQIVQKMRRLWTRQRQPAGG